MVRPQLQGSLLSRCSLERRSAGWYPEDHSHLPVSILIFVEARYCTVRYRVVGVARIPLDMSFHDGRDGFRRQ
jgi:hypothetical protein